MDINSDNEKHIAKRLSSIVETLGKLTTEEHGEKRLNHCLTRNAGKPCEYMGKVEPLPGLVFKLGCQKCGCSLRIKTRTKYLGFKKLHKKITCPHELGNLWQEIDRNFIF